MAIKKLKLMLILDTNVIWKKSSIKAIKNKGFEIIIPDIVGLEYKATKLRELRSKCNNLNKDISDIEKYGVDIEAVDTKGQVERYSNIIDEFLKDDSIQTIDIKVDNFSDMIYKSSLKEEDTMFSTKNSTSDVNLKDSIIINWADTYANDNKGTKFLMISGDKNFCFRAHKYTKSENLHIYDNKNDNDLSTLVKIDNLCDILSGKFVNETIKEMLETSKEALEKPSEKKKMEAIISSLPDPTYSSIDIKSNSENKGLGQMIEDQIEFDNLKSALKITMRDLINEKMGTKKTGERYRIRRFITNKEMKIEDLNKFIDECNDYIKANLFEDEIPSNKITIVRKGSIPIDDFKKIINIIHNADNQYKESVVNYITSNFDRNYEEYDDIPWNI